MKRKEKLKVYFNYNINIILASREERIKTLMNTKNLTRQKAVDTVAYADQLFSHYSWSNFIFK
jgi:hypothetical protein